MGLSGYGFSLDDDAADISGNFSTRLGVAIGGLNGLPNHFEWSNAAPYGPVSAEAKVLSDLEIATLPPYAFFSLQPYNANEKIPGANISGVGVPAGTYLYAFGNGGLYAYSYLLSHQPPPSQNPLPPAPSPGPLQIPPLVLNGTSLFTIPGPGTANGLPLTLPAGQTTSAGPYMNTLRDLNIPAGSTLTITSLLGNLTSYTQQYEQMARVSMVATPDSQDGKATPVFVPNAPFPDLGIVVDGILDAGRVEIVNGFLSGTGTVKGSLNVFGPVSGYANPIELKPVGNEPVDPSWNNPTNSIRGTDGGFLAAGKRDGTPGKLTVTGDVSLFGASFAAYARGTTMQGSDYSWLSSNGKVHLGNSKLELSLIGYTPRTGDSLTLITAAEGLTGQFSQGSSITVNGFTFNITYNANSVVLTYAPAPGSTPPPSPPPSPAPSPHAAFVTSLYRILLGREPDPAGLTGWVQSLDGGVPRPAVERHILASPEYRGRQVDALYATCLHRAADPDGRAAWVAALADGLSETDAARLFMTSPEYTLSHPDEASFVFALYADVLGRTPDEVGLNSWIEAARRGQDRAAIADAFLHSLEASQRTVTGYYAQFLGRAPDAVGFEVWSELLQSRRASRDQVVQAFLASDEFFVLAAV